MASLYSWQILTHDPLNGDNYYSWFDNFEIHIGLNFLSEVLKPAWHPITPEEKQKDFTALTLLKATVSDDFKRDLRTINTFQHALEVVQQNSIQKGARQQVNIQKQMHNLKLEDWASMREYLGQLKILRDKYLGAGGNIDDATLIIHALNGLTKEYRYITNHYELKKCIKLTFNQMQHQLMEAEARYKMDDHVEAVNYSKVFNCSQKDVVHRLKKQALKAEAKILELQAMIKQRDSALTAANCHLDFLLQVNQGTEHSLEKVTQQLQHALDTSIVLEKDLKVANAKLEFSERTVAELCSSLEKESLILEDQVDASEPIISDIFYLPVPTIDDNSRLSGTSCDYQRSPFAQSSHLELDKVQQGFLHDDYFFGDVCHEVTGVADPERAAKQCCLDLNLHKDQLIKEEQSAGNIRSVMELDIQFEMLQQSVISELSKGTGGAKAGAMQYYLGISSAEILIRQRHAFLNITTGHLEETYRGRKIWFKIRVKWQSWLYLWLSLLHILKGSVTQVLLQAWLILWLSLLYMLQADIFIFSSARHQEGC